jgi:hypothetical protein
MLETTGVGDRIHVSGVEEETNILGSSAWIGTCIGKLRKLVASCSRFCLLKKEICLILPRLFSRESDVVHDNSILGRHP